MELKFHFSSTDKIKVLLDFKEILCTLRSGDRFEFETSRRVYLNSEIIPLLDFGKHRYILNCDMEDDKKNYRVHVSIYKVDSYDYSSYIYAAGLSLITTAIIFTRK